MINRFRVVLPRDSMIVGFVLCFLIVEGPILFLEWKIQQPVHMARPSLFLLRLVAFFYGCWRLSSFHPATQPSYLAWLERGPWSYKKPLPAGPIHLVWEDLLPLCGLTILAAFLGPMIPYQILGLFLFGYLAILASTSFRTSTKGFGYLIFFGIGLALRSWQDPRRMLAIEIGVYLVGMIALRWALMRFPWPFLVEAKTIGELQKLESQSCGWPFDQLKPLSPSRWRLSWFDGLMTGCLSGWFLFAAESLYLLRPEQETLVMVVFFCSLVMLTCLRTLIYVMGYAPPISLIGRIRTFRWIIPRYDKVFLGPICTLLVGVLALDRFRPPGLDDLIVLPIALAVAITVTIDTGPSLVNWRLTGQHQITSNAEKRNGEYAKVG